MVPVVADDDVRESANADLGTVRDSAPCPVRIDQVREEFEMRPCDSLEFFEQLAECMPVELGNLGVRVLVETRQRGRIAAGEPQRAVAEDPIGVRHVTDDFLDAPGLDSFP